MHALAIDKFVALVNVPPSTITNPSISLGKLSEYLFSRDINHKIFDANLRFFKSSDDRMKDLWKIENHYFWNNSKTGYRIAGLYSDRIEELVTALGNPAFDIVAFSSADPKEFVIIEIIKRLKKRFPQKKIIVGGPSCSTQKNLNLYINNIPNMIDGFVVGEGEETLYDVIHYIRNDYSLDYIPGLRTYNGGMWNKFEEREPIDIDELPFPRYTEFDLSSYDVETLGVVTSRGCISRCSFCKEWTLWKGYRFRKAEKILEEIRYHVENNGVKYITFYDSLFNGDMKNLERFCELVIESGLEFRWSAQAIPRKEMTPKILKKMKEAGCHTLVYGVESASDDVLKRMGKLNRIKETEKVVRDTYEAGILTAVNIMVGFPGETEKDIQMTKDFLTRNRHMIGRIDSLSSLQLVNGTEIYNKSKTYGITLPEKEEANRWYIGNDNTFEKRSKALSDMKTHINSLGIPMNRDFSIEEPIRASKDIDRVFRDKFLPDRSPVMLFFECLFEHGPIYTAKHTYNYLKYR